MASYNNSGKLTSYHLFVSINLKHRISMHIFHGVCANSSLGSFEKNCENRITKQIRVPLNFGHWYVYKTGQHFLQSRTFCIYISLTHSLWKKSIIKWKNNLETGQRMYTNEPIFTQDALSSFIFSSATLAHLVWTLVVSAWWGWIYS